MTFDPSRLHNEAAGSMSAAGFPNSPGTEPRDGSALRSAEEKHSPPPPPPLQDVGASPARPPPHYGIATISASQPPRSTKVAPSVNERETGIPVERASFPRCDGEEKEVHWGGGGG